jgi:hypothetical protein
MALLTPVQQGKFVLALKTWHEKMKENLEKWGKRLVRATQNFSKLAASVLQK